VPATTGGATVAVAAWFVTVGTDPSAVEEMLRVFADLAVLDLLFDGH
jgi:hypothetical protein